VTAAITATLHRFGSTAFALPVIAASTTIVP
jgi:hypothetical protein